MIATTLNPMVYCVIGEQVEPRHNDRTGEAWMYGRFNYELYRRVQG